jgi:hypothetical protein
MKKSEQWRSLRLKSKLYGDPTPGDAVLNIQEELEK